jgi:hypothetical protein
MRDTNFNVAERTQGLRRKGAFRRSRGFSLTPIIEASESQ